MTNELALALFAGITIIVNIILAFFQFRETRRLAELTSSLQVNVHRLSTEFDQRMQRLQRARELCNDLHKAIEITGRTQNFSELAMNLADYRVSLTELVGTVDAIGDEKLLSLLNNDLFEALAKLDPSLKFEVKQTKINQILPLLAHFYRRLNELAAEYAQN